MKIQHIKITNITSLRGVHELPLERLIGREGLFAITGATGAGKSSLLTAITLALYGTGHKSKLSATDYVSTGEEFAEVELQFEFKNSNYLAFWGIRTVGSRGKVLAKPVIIRKLFRDGIPQDLSAEQLLGLSFEQFTRTVILNQGEFAKFLTSNFTDRKKILENLYEGEGLSEITRILKLEIKEQESQLIHLDSLIEAILPMDESEAQIKRAELKQKLDESQAKNEDQHTLLECSKQLKGIISLYKDEQNLEQKKRDKKNRLIEEEKRFFEQEYLKQQQSILMNNLQAKRLEYRGLFDQATKNFERLEYIQSQAQKRGVLVKATLSQIKKLHEQKQDKETYIKNYRQEQKNNQEHLQHLGIKDLDFSTLATHSLHQLLTQRLQSQQQEKALFQRINENAQELEVIEQEAKELKDKIGSLQAELKNHQSNELEADSKQALDQLNQYVLLQSHAMHAFNQQQKIKQQAFQCGQEYEQLRLDLKAMESKRDQLKESLSKQEFIFWKNKITHHLHEESSVTGRCVLCHSSQTLIPPDHEESPLDNDKTQAQLQQMEEQILELSLKIQIHHQRQQDFEQKNEESETILHQFQQRFQLEATPDHWQHYQQKLENHLKQITVIKQECDKKAQQVETMLEQLTKERKKYALKKENLVKAQNEQKELSQRINDLNQTIILALKTTHLKPLDFTIPIIEACLKCVTGALELHPLEQSLNFLDQSLQKEKLNITQLEAEEKEQQELKLQASTQWNNAQTELRAAFGAYIPQNEFPSSPEDIQLQLDVWVQNQTQKMAQIENEYLERKRSKEASEQLINQLNEQYKAIEQTMAHHRSQLQTLLVFDFKHLPSKLVSALNKVKSLLIEGELIPEISVQELIQRFYADQLIPAQEQLSLELKNDLEAINSTQALLQIFDQKKHEQMKYAQQAQEIKTQLTIKKDLALVLGKDEFRSFALGLIEDKLLSLTNIELKKLCDSRYQLRPTKTHFGQDFMIIDYFQYAHERKIETLSGGETFLVSLAMALSLAEMSRGTTEINCFFIDEGFGSLDQDALDDVLDVLHSIRTRGKQLGIISHIKELTERIPMVIKLHKGAHGHSEIQLSHER